ncbi:gliding motility-associated C-terminal domain-containing protein [Lewinella sp. 4G2]|uniref:T9SS type B sorting domain-containing protein n=1 Tax=Lewinella sp. 4G2 TaxID=1803372 RepID=UPI0018D40BBD|nr:gliding motility-associated C-terminal domain-containing protein [Lewinella sp. 4G2]
MPAESDFDIRVTSEARCGLCLRQDDGDVALNPRNEASTYACGATVNACFTLDRYVGNQGGSVEWLHSITMDFGPGWDVSSIVPTVIPGSCNGNGSWGWYPDGWTGCFTGEFFERGFAYESGAGTNGGGGCNTNNSNDPGDNYGDGGPGCTTRPGSTTFCWNITVKDCDDTFAGEDLGICVKVFSDGASGSWRNRVCAEEFEYCSIGEVVICDDDDPLADPTPQTCPDFADGSVIISPDGGNGGTQAYNVTIRTAGGDLVTRCVDCVGPQTFTDLDAGSYIAETINLGTGCPLNVEFTIEPGEYPEITAEFEETCPSDGAINLTAEVLAGDGSAIPGTSVIEYTWTGPNGFMLVSNDATVQTNDPADEGTYIVTATVDGCPTDNSATIDVEYSPEPTLNVIDPTLCVGDDLFILSSGGAGPSVWYRDGVPIPGENGANLNIEVGADWASPITTISFESLGATCPGPVDIDISVFQLPDPLIAYTADSVICTGDDITLSATMQDGSAFPIGTQFRWAGSVANNTATYSIPGAQNMTPGNIDVELFIRSPQGCQSTTIVTYTIGEDPVAMITPPNPTICNTGSVELVVNESAGMAPFTYQWSNDASVTADRQTFDGSSPVTSGIQVTVTDANGCTTVTNAVDVNVVSDLPPVVFGDCDDSDVSSITFTWSDVGQTQFEVYYTIGTDPEVLVDLDYMATSYTVAPTTPGQIVTMRVIPKIIAGAETCFGPENSQTCEVLNCFSPGWQFTQPAPICLLDDPQEYDFTITAMEDGDIFLTSPELGLDSLPADPSGTTTISLPPLAAGVRTGTYTIVANHVSFAGVCTFDRTVVLDVVAPPERDFVVSAPQVCQGGEASFEYVADATGLTFEWQFPAGVTVISGDITTAGPITAQFDTDAGFQDVNLVLVDPVCGNVDAAGGIEVIAPLTPPVITCGPAGVLSVNFEWDAQAGASGYEVTIDGGAPFTITDTNYGLSGLTENQEVVITIRALGTGICGDGEASTQSCFAALCPNLVANYNGLVDNICLLNGDETIDLSGITVEGGSGIMSTLSFSGPGVMGTTFDAAAAGGSEAGTTHTITLDYVEEGPCPYSTTFDIIVYERPSVFIIGADEVCVNGEVTITVGSTNLVANDDITLDFDGGTVIDDGNPDDNVYRVAWATSGNKTITGSVVSNISGCESLEETLPVTVFDSLAAPVITCNDAAATLTTVTFEWGAVAGAEGWVISSPSGVMETLPLGERTYTISNLLPGESAELTVIAQGTGPCGNGPAATAMCTTMDCPPNAIDALTPDTGICLDGTEAAVSLSAALDDGSPLMGTIVWSGAGVTGTPGSEIFDPAGLAQGIYTIFVDYDGPSICDTRDSVVFTLLPPPEAVISTTPPTVCAGTTISVGLDVVVNPLTTYVWDWDGGTPTALGNEQYEVSWDTPGSKTVRLTATGACSNEDSFVIDVTPTLDAPVPTCVRQDLDGVRFEWPLVGAASEGYQVSVNGGPLGPVQTDPFFEVSGLERGETVTISVISVRSGTDCNTSPAAEATCSARECPTISLAPAAAQTDFCDDDVMAVALNVTISGDDGTGTTTWSGDGVVDNGDGTFSFDPVAAGVGSHTLTVGYVQEVLCSYDNTMVMNVFATPAAAFSASELVVCADGEVRITMNDAPGSAVVTPDFGGGTGTQVAPGEYVVTFPSLGEYTVTISTELNGCTDFASVVITAQESSTAGDPVGGNFELCVGDPSPIELSTRLMNADAGGTWAAVTGDVPSSSLDAVTGTLSRGNLAAGNYVFSYTVGGNSCPVDVAEVSLTLLADPVVEAGPDQTLTCQMGMVTLDGSGSENGPGFAYEWTSNNPDAMIVDADQPMIDVSQPGVYYLEVSNSAGCINRDSVLVTVDVEAPTLEVEISNITCFANDDGAILVTAVNGGLAPYSYTLNGEPRGESTLFNGLAPDEYTIRVTDAKGCFSDLIIDLDEPEELTISLRFPGDSSEVNFGDQVFITATINGGNVIDTLLWQPDSLKTTTEGNSGIEFIADETRMISVTVVDELGCRATDNQMLIVRKVRPVYFPSAFSPNGDGNNDIYFINADADLITSIQDFEIYTRWGELVYSSNSIEGIGDFEGRFPPNDPNFGWDGRHNGVYMNPQVLVYTARVNFSDGESVVYKGDFVLMR